jgi:hypothetical protein
LYGWAQGLPGITPYEFVSKALAFNTKDAISRLTKVTLSLLENQLLQRQETRIPSTLIGRLKFRRIATTPRRVVADQSRAPSQAVGR